MNPREANTLVELVALKEQQEKQAQYYFWIRPHEQLNAYWMKKAQETASKIASVRQAG